MFEANELLINSLRLCDPAVARVTFVSAQWTNWYFSHELGIFGRCYWCMWSAKWLSIIEMTSWIKNTMIPKVIYCYNSTHVESRLRRKLFKEKRQIIGELFTWRWYNPHPCGEDLPSRPWTFGIAEECSSSAWLESNTLILETLPNIDTHIKCV